MSLVSNELNEKTTLVFWLWHISSNYRVQLERAALRMQTVALLQEGTSMVFDPKFMAPLPEFYLISERA